MGKTACESGRRSCVVSEYWRRSRSGRRAGRETACGSCSAGSRASSALRHAPSAHCCSDEKPCVDPIAVSVSLAVVQPVSEQHMF